MKNFIETGAIFSPCDEYRYSLMRSWRGLWDEEKTVLFVMLNPSTADENLLDPTVRRCVGYADDWGYNKLFVGNLFALRSTDPKKLYDHPAPIGPFNDEWLRRMHEQSDLTICAWGVHGRHRGRADAVRELLGDVHILKLTKDGLPCHPLYLKKDLKPKEW